MKKIERNVITFLHTYKKTRMTIFIKTKFQQIRWSDEYWQYRVAANITEYQNNIPKFMEKKQLFHVKNHMYVKMSKINEFKCTYGLFGHNYRVAALSKLYLTVLWIIIPSLES